MRLFFKFLICNGFYILFLFNSAWAANTSYYVDATRGSDSNSGRSHAQAWKTLSKVNSYSFSTGDNVYLLCGETWIGKNIVVDWSGTPEDYAVVGAYYMDGSESIGVNGDGKPKIDGNGTAPGLMSGLVKVTLEEYVTIQDLYLNNSVYYGFTNTRGASHLIVQRCKITHTQRDNLHFYRADNVQALYNECGYGAESYKPGDSNWQCGGILLKNNKNAVAKYNYVYNQLGEGIDIGNGSIVMHNRVVNTRSKGIYMNAVDDCEVAYNLIIGTNDTTYEFLYGFHNAGICVNIEPTYTHTANGNKIHHNIVINTYAGIQINNSQKTNYNTYYVDNIFIYNNVFIDNRDNILTLNSTKYNTRNIRYRNNLSYVNSELASHTSSSDSFPGWTISHNAWYGDELPSGDWRDETDITTNPKLNKTSWRDTESLNNETFTISDLLPASDWAGVVRGVDLGADYDDAWHHSTALPHKEITTITSQTFDIGAIKVTTTGEGQPLQPPTNLIISPE